MGRRPVNVYLNSHRGLVLLARVATLKIPKTISENKRIWYIKYRSISEILIRIIEWNEVNNTQNKTFWLTHEEASQIPIIQETIEHMRTCNTCKCANVMCQNIRSILTPYFWRFHNGIIKRHFAKEDIPRAIKIQMALTSINLIPKGQY